MHYEGRFRSKHVAFENNNKKFVLSGMLVNEYFLLSNVL